MNLADEWIIILSKNYIIDYPFPSYHEISLYVELLHTYTSIDNHNHSSYSNKSNSFYNNKNDNNITENSKSVTEIALELLRNTNKKFHPSNYDLIDELHTLSMNDGCDLDVNSKLYHIDVEIKDYQLEESNDDITQLLAISNFQYLWKSK